MDQWRPKRATTLLILLTWAGLAACGKETADEEADPTPPLDASVVMPPDPDPDAAVEEPASDAATAPDSVAPPATDAAPPAPEILDCLPARDAGDFDVTCGRVGVHVSIPAACETGTCGLVLDVHGLTMNGAMEDANTSMRRLGREHGYVVLQPSAPGISPVASWGTGENDDALVAIVESAIALYGVDAARVHLMGFSQGGDVTWRLLCEHSELFASVAPAGSTGGCHTGYRAAFNFCFSDGRVPVVETPILYMHGRREGNMYALWECAEGQRDAVVHELGMEVVETDEQPDYTRTLYRNAAGTDFVMLAHDYVSTRPGTFPAVPLLEGHCYPGSEDPGTELGQILAFGCDPPTAFHWGEEVMQFFIDHPRAD